MPNFDFTKPTAFQTTWPLIQINGVGVDPSVIKPLILEVNSGGAPSVLHLEILRSFDDLSGLDLGINTIELLGSSPDFLDDGGQAEDPPVYFRGILASRQLAFSSNRNSITLSVPDITWRVDSDFAEFDLVYVTPAEALNILFNGDAVSEEPTASAKIDSAVMQLGSDPAILGDVFQGYPIGGLPVYQAIVDIVNRAGNMLTWITYDSSKAYFQFAERHTGELRHVIKGDGSTDLSANVVSIDGNEDATRIANRVIGRGDKLIRETTIDDEGSGNVEFRPDWDSQLDATVLADPGIVHRDPKYEAVGRRYILSGEGIDAAGILPSLVEFIDRTPGLFEAQQRSKDIQVLRKETQNSTSWFAFEGDYQLRPRPPERETVGGDRMNDGNDILLWFKDTQAYKNISADQDTFTNFRDFRVTYSYRVNERKESSNFGRISVDSGLVGSFPIERKRLLKDSRFKYISRRSIRPNFDTGGNLLSFPKVSRTVRDDSFRFRRLCFQTAKQNSKPIGAVRIQLRGDEAPDFSWWPGQRVVSVRNSTDYLDVDWDITGVVFDLQTGGTTLLLEDLEAARAVI